MHKRSPSGFSCSANVEVIMVKADYLLHCTVNEQRMDCILDGAVLCRMFLLFMSRLSQVHVAWDRLLSMWFVKW